MENNKTNKKLKEVEVIIEPSEETIDFTDFVREVLEYQMVRVCAIACFVDLERPQEKLEGPGKSK